MFKIDTDKLKKEIDLVNSQSDLMEQKIGEFLNDSDLSDQKTLELCQVGKFLTLFDNDKIEILDQCESPDFIISVNDIKIGLEHETILNGQKVKQIQSINYLFNQAAKTFEIKYPDIKVLANCWLKKDDFSFRKIERKTIINQIVDYIYGLTQNLNINKPDFIDYIRIMKHSGVSFSFNADISNIESLDNLTLINAIEKKERLIDKYIKNSRIQKHWLLIVIGQLSPDAFEIDKFNYKIADSKFERIYLLEDFNAKKYKLK